MYVGVLISQHNYNIKIVQAACNKRLFLCVYSLLEVRYGGREVKMVTQDVKCGDEVTPLD